MKRNSIIVLATLGIALAGLALAAGGHFSPETLSLLPALGAVGMINAKAGEKLAVVGTVDPQAVVNVEKFTDVVDMGLFHQCLGVALLGDWAAETIDFKCYSCDSDGNNAVALKSCTQLAAHASNNDNKQLVISVRADELIDSTKTHIKFGLVSGSTSGGTGAVLALAVDAREQLASADDLASVVEIKL